MNGPGIYCIRYFPEMLEWRVIKDNYTDYALNKIFHNKDNLLAEEYCIYLESVDDVAAFTIAVSKIEKAMEGKEEN